MICCRSNPESLFKYYSRKLNKYYDDYDIQYYLHKVNKDPLDKENASMLKEK